MPIANKNVIRVSWNNGANKGKKFISGIKRISKPGLRVYSQKRSAAPESSVVSVSQWSPLLKAWWPIKLPVRLVSVEKCWHTSGNTWKIGGAHKCLELVNNQLLYPLTLQLLLKIIWLPLKVPKANYLDQINKDMKLTLENGVLTVERPSDEKNSSFHARSFPYSDQQHGCRCNHRFQQIFRNCRCRLSCR